MIILPTEKVIDWKHPPLALFLLVLINILIFAFYQSDDDRLLRDAVEIYQSNELLAMEGDAHQAYSATLEPNERVRPDDPSLIWYIVTDQNFSVFLEENYRVYIEPENRAEWRLAREQFEDTIDRLSHNALGLKADDISVVTVLSYQFLHGDIVHLLGNMVFLLLTGFAVEAALGHLRFIAYYLISGIGAGLLFAFAQVVTGGGNVSLIGASGAVSGVMAMYVSLFKFRKIEFFYWFFIFTGYFRAAAVIILPAYILKEIYMLLMYDGSNVAYIAHIGGFIVGGALVLTTQLIRHKAIDSQYLDAAEVPIDPYRKDLNRLYLLIANCEFKQAWISLQTIKKQHPDKLELLDIKFNLLVALDREKASDYLMWLLGGKVSTAHISRAQANRWQKMSAEEKAALSFVKQAGLINNSLSIDLPNIAEKVFAEIESNFHHNQPLEQNTKDQGKRRNEREEVAVLSRKIALYYQQIGRADIAEKYDKLAKEIMLKSMDLTDSGAAV